MLDIISLEEIVSDNSGKIPPVYLYYIPEEPLRRFIELFWYMQKTDLLRGMERVLPTGTVKLVIDLESRRSSGSLISGIKSKSVIISDINHFNRTNRILGIHFKPGGAFPFLPFPLQELSDCDITLAELWGEQQASQLLSLIHQSITVSGKFRVLERWLLMHLFQPLHHHPAVTTAAAELQCMPSIPVKNLAEQVNLSHRQFIQVFQKEVGLTPKLYARIMRFQKVLDTIDTVNGIVWSAVADVSGYFDQSHFIHEFQEFSGITPTAYMDIRTEHRNHLPIRH